eukprot:TRINITY_DN105399_c0_g1_i1.p1 TRINITY_DN105399_c0_g1~~TRINITY_DN105399_c0_g1_i1.p1  ORF type:complete len:112 (-),score=21.23 TRINITY_DN105399_c0_g1_i1:38-373(-)
MKQEMYRPAENFKEVGAKSDNSLVEFLRPTLLAQIVFEQILHHIVSQFCVRNCDLTIVRNDDASMSVNDDPHPCGCSNEHLQQCYRLSMMSVQTAQPTKKLEQQSLQMYKD